MSYCRVAYTVAKLKRIIIFYDMYNHEIFATLFFFAILKIHAALQNISSKAAYKNEILKRI